MTDLDIIEALQAAGHTPREAESAIEAIEERGRVAVREEWQPFLRHKGDCAIRFRDYMADAPRGKCDCGLPAGDVL